MKKILLYLFILMSFQLNNAYSQANQQLSNLTAAPDPPVAINQSLVPGLVLGVDNVLDLGSTTIEWRNMYLGTSIFFTRTTETPPVLMFLNGNRFIHNIGGSPGGIINQSLFAGEGAGQNVKSTDDVNNGCVGIGYQALNTLGNGYLATGDPGVGNHNTAVGWRAMLYLNGKGTPGPVSADKNTMVGSRAGEWLSFGRENTGLGYNAFYNGTTTITTSFIEGIGNTGIGGAVDVGTPIVSFGVLGLVTTGDYNTALGYGSGIRLTTGSNNIILGDNAGINLAGNIAGTAALRNTIIGSSAAAALVLGNDNIFIGQNANYSGDVSNFLNIGNTIYGDLLNDEISIGSDLTSSMFNVGATNQFQVNNAGRINNYNGIATVNNGVASQVAVVNVGGQTATIPNTNLYTTTAEGFYKVSYMGLITVAGVDGTPVNSASSLSLRIKYDDPTYLPDVVLPSVNVENMNSISNNVVGNGFSGSLLIYVAAGSTITYKATYTCTCSVTPMQYTLRIVLEKL